MSFLSRLLPFRASASAPVPRAKAHAHTSLSAPHESGSRKEPRTIGWYPPDAAPTRAAIATLTLIRNRSRDAARNSLIARAFLDRFVTAVVGTGFQPLSQAPDPAFRRAIHAVWNRFSSEISPDGTLDVDGLVSLAVRSMLESGEVFLRLRTRLEGDGLAVPLQVQVMESEFCPEWLSRMEPNGNITKAGIEFDKIGGLAAYWFWRARPGEVDAPFVDANLTRVPAENVIHMFRPDRPGQLRGVPALAPALVKLRDLDSFDDATLVRQKLAAMFVAFLKKPSTDPSSMAALVGDDVSTEAARPTLTLQPGAFQELAPGEEVQWSTPPDSPNFESWMESQLRIVAAGLGVPLQVLLGKYESDRTARVVLQDFRRGIQAFQWQIVIHQLIRPLWNRFFEYAVDSNAVPEFPMKEIAAYGEVTFAPQSWPYISPTADVAAARDAVASGFASRSTVARELGDDAEHIDQQQAADNARADAAGLKYQSDGRVIAAKPFPLAPDSGTKK